MYYSFEFKNAWYNFNSIVIFLKLIRELVIANEKNLKISV